MTNALVCKMCNTDHTDNIITKKCLKESFDKFMSDPHNRMIMEMLGDTWQTNETNWRKKTEITTGVDTMWKQQLKYFFSG